MGRPFLIPKTATPAYRTFMDSLMTQLLEEQPIKKLKEGSIIQGIVTEIRQNEVMVDIGAKAEGAISHSEFVDLGDLEVGSEIEILLEKLENRNGSPCLSFDKAEQKKNWQTILTKCQEGSVIAGRIKSKVKGGLIVNIGVDAFLPASQIDTHSSKDLDRYVGQTYDFKVIKINFDRRNIIISRRELLEEQRQQKRTNLLSKIKPGDVLQGVVKNITDYGAFIDLDGLDGLLHVNDMSWGRIAHPSELLKVGEEINVVITEIDLDRERVSLGLKQMKENPWKNIKEHFSVHARVRGKVVNLVPYGAFIELEEGVKALVHVTELSWSKRITKPSEILKIGQEVEAVVLNIQEDEQRISLGIRQLQENPWDMAKHNYPVGARVRGKVCNLTNYGAFIELEPGIDGMVHFTDISWTRKINHPREVLKKDDQVEAIVLDVNIEQQRIALGLKQLSPDPWKRMDDYFKVGDLVKGRVGKISPFGVFLHLDHDIDGLVHISQISEKHVEDIKEVLTVGQEVTARVIKMDKDKRQIALSIKAAHYDETELTQEIDTFNKLKDDGEMMTLDSVLDQASQ